MNMKALMIVVYGFGGVATLVGPHGLVSGRSALIALLVMCLAHLSWRTLAAKRRNQASDQHLSMANKSAVARPVPCPVEPVPGEDLV